MSLKSIDTQLSLSRARDVGAIQNQMNHKASDDQMSLAAQAHKRQEQELKKTLQLNKSPELPIKDQQSKNQGQDGYHPAKNQQKTEDDSHVCEHPYKGQRFDITL